MNDMVHDLTGKRDNLIGCRVDGFDKPFDVRIVQQHRMDTKQKQLSLNLEK